jgi:cell division protease FtsH
MNNKYELIKKQLKKEFFGVDKQIDQILSSFEAWETIREYQTSPYICNIWGMTGTGKSEIINHIIKLLKVEDDIMYLKLNARINNFTNNMINNDLEYPIFIFDEIQYLRSINEKGEEIKNNNSNYDELQNIWNLMDSGVISYNTESSIFSSGFYVPWHIIDGFLEQIKINNGTYNNGIIHCDNLLDILMDNYNYSYISLSRLSNIKNRKDKTDITYSSSYNLSDDKDKKIISYAQNKNIIDKEIYSTNEILLLKITEGFNSLYKMHNNKNINNKFNDISEYIEFIYSIKDLDELIKYFNKLKRQKINPLIKHFEKSFIINIGNLDEAFEVSKSPESDLNADILYKETSKINMVHIRKALLSRFRVEQIGRLGSNHIIFPSLSKKAFKDIINKELNIFKDNIMSKFPADNDKCSISNIEFSNSIHTLIYNEGVFPVLGARSVSGAITEIVREKFSDIIQEMLRIKDSYENVNIIFDYNKRKSTILIKFYNNNNILIKQIDKHYDIKIDKLRYETKENIGKQAHRAVHEAGHAICSIILNKDIPEVVYSTVLNGNNSAFNVLDKDSLYYIRKNTYINNIATLMAGYASELLIFGEENISQGSSNDIEKATYTLNHLFKNCGLGNKIGNYVSQQMPHGDMFTMDRNYSIVDKNEIDGLVQEKIDDGIRLALSVLTEQKTLLLKVVEYLIKNPRIDSKKLKTFVKKYAINFNYNELNTNKTMFYLDIVKNELNKI